MTRAGGTRAARLVCQLSEGSITSASAAPRNFLIWRDISPGRAVNPAANFSTHTLTPRPVYARGGHATGAQTAGRKNNDCLLICFHDFYKYFLGCVQFVTKTYKLRVSSILFGKQSIIRPGNLGFVVLQCSSKSHFQAIFTIIITKLWTRSNQ